ncbi:Ig-like protein, group 1 [Corallincola luteus]|uniref:Ig-like protein, group 1 n=1 Tax=Corallincola luteus TaxID=1775177 RepID=A0ABY2AKY0_9GAMM|nr:Ig-like domain-containing protein [Corallincola luteus]TCI03544.1 Ig-like protein, group 1 [Corallincola luteus]
MISKALSRYLFTLCTLLSLVACNGSSGDGDFNEFNQLELTLRNSEGDSTNTLTAGETAWLEAKVVDVYGEGIDGQIVDFSSSLGSLSASSALTDGGGKARVQLLTTGVTGAGTLTASTTLESVDGSSEETLTASSNFQVNASGGTNEALQLTILADDCLSPTSPSFVAGSSFCLQASLSNDDGPVVDTIVSFSAPLGTLASDSRLTDANGIANVLVSSDDTSVGAATATATTGELSEQAVYEFTSTGDIGGGESPSLAIVMLDSGTPVNRFNAGSNVQLRATLLDGESQPLENQVISFTAGLGTLTPVTALTAANGQAEVTLTGTDTDLGADQAIATVSVDDLTLSASLSYEILARDAIGDGDTILLGYWPDKADPASFQNGVVGIATDSISAGGTVGLTVDLVEMADDGSLSALLEPATVSFTSGCSADGKASLDATAQTIAGRAQATFQDQSCASGGEISDSLLATVSNSSSTLNALATLTIEAEALGSIEFVSAEPEQIVLKGTGGQGNQESSTVTFLVKGSQGSLLPQRLVCFSLDTQVGGLSLSQQSGLTNSEGLVTTKVQSGNVPTPVRVTAQTQQDATACPLTGDDIIQSQSDLLTINTGLAEQSSFTLSPDILNPEAWRHNGETVTLTVWLADSFNNPAPDGTTVNFTAEAGQITPSCQTVSGSCQATWTSTDPRPTDHRVTILASAVGHETFFDNNGNGIFDEADGTAIAAGASVNAGFSQPGVVTGFVDMSEAWRDDDESFIRETDEPFLDYANSGGFNLADGLFNGPQCSGSLCGSADAGNNKLHIRRAIVLIMSDSAANWELDYLNGSFDDSSTQQQGAGNTGVIGASGVTLNAGAAANLSFHIGDSMDQILPEGTTIVVASDQGDLTGTTNITVANSRGTAIGSADSYRDTVSFSLLNTLAPGDPTEVGFITVTITTPKGLGMVLQVPLTMTGL